MDDKFKLNLDSDKLRQISDALKPNAKLQKALEGIKSFPGLSAKDFPSAHHDFNDLLKISPPPTQEEINNYQSSSALMEALSKEALLWKEKLPENYKPAILAILYGGLQIHVQSLSQVGFHGIKIVGTLNGGPCSLLAHQTTVQMLCYGEEITKDTPKRPIGFIWSGGSVEV